MLLEQNTSLKQQVGRGLKWKALTIVGRQAISLLVFTFIARILDPSAFGAMSLIGAYIAIASVFADQGMTTAVVQRRELAPEHLDAIFWFGMACSLFLGACTMVGANSLAHLLGDPKLTSLLRWSALGFIITGCSSVQAALLARQMKFKELGMRTIIGSLGGGVVGVTMAYSGYGVWSLVGQQLVTAVLAAGFLWRTSTFRPRLQFSWRYLRDLFSISSCVFGTSILWLLSSKIDQLVIGRLAGIVELGLYSVAGKGCDIITMVTHQPLAAVSLSGFSRIQCDNERLCRAIYEGMEINAVIAVPLFFGLAATAIEVVPLTFGKQWESAAPLCALLCISTLITALQVFVHPALVASGGVGKYLLLNVWHTIGVLVISVFTVGFGVKFLILGLIVNNLVITIPALLFLKGRIGLSPGKYCKPCLVPLLAATTMVLVVCGCRLWMREEVRLLLRACILVAVGALTYVSILGCLQPQSLRKTCALVVRPLLQAG